MLAHAGNACVIARINRAKITASFLATKTTRKSQVEISLNDSNFDIQRGSASAPLLTCTVILNW